MTLAQPRRSARGLRLLLCASVALLFAGGLSPYAGASAPAPSAASGTSWAYAGNRTVAGTETIRGSVVTISEWVGYDVLLTELPSSGSVLRLEVNRTMGARISAQYCYPSCSSALLTGTVSYHAFERLAGFANLTSNGTVATSNGAVAAIAELNGSAALRIGVFDNDSETYHGPLSVRHAVSNLSLTELGAYSVAFSPGLGIVPTSAPTVGESWTSTSAYVAAGTAQASWSLVRSYLDGASVDLSGSPSASLDTNGTVVLSGADRGPLTLSDGAAVQQIGLTLSGGLTLREGFLFLPADADLFGATPPSSLPSGNGSLSESFSALDLGAAVGSHPGFLASAASYTPSPTQSGSSPDEAAGAAPLVASPPASFVVQAEPEPVSAAEIGSGCTLAGTCASTGGAAPAGLRPLVGVVAGVGLAAAVAIVAVAVSRRPRVPPRPNAELYPMIVRAPSTPPIARAPPLRGSAPPKDEASEADPLSHLW